MIRRSHLYPNRQGGFSLVELMVSLLIGLAVIAAALTIQFGLTKQNVRMSETAVRDNETRAAMDMIRRDLSSAGFLFGRLNSACQLMLAYDSGAAGAGGGAGYFAVTPVDAIDGGAAVKLPFTGATGFNVTYPPTGVTNRSQALVIRGSADTSKFSESLTPTVSATSSTTITPTTSGILPMVSTTGFNVGDTVLVKVPVGTVGTQQLVCMRAGVSAVTANTSITLNKAPFMPTNFFAGFSAQMLNFGMTDTLSDVLLMESKVINLGAAATAGQVTYVYFVEQPAGQWPRLVRATLNSLTEIEIAGSRQVVASGVVSLQVLFGVDVGNTGAVTNYVSGASVIANDYYAIVRTAKVLLVTRAIYADPQLPLATAATTIDLATQYGEAGYQNYVYQPADSQYRYSTQEEVIAVRNNLWVNN